MTLLMVLAGCESPSGGEAASPDLGIPAVGGGGTPITIEVKGGSGFGCFVAARVGGGESLYCAGTNAPLSLNGTAIVEYAHTAGTFDAFEIWDDTICVTTQVSLRPYSRFPGQGLYCWGEASLGFNYSAYDLIYGGPNYSDVTNGSPELTYAVLPFVGGDESMDLMTNTGGTWLVMMDGSSSVTTQSLSCDVSSEGILDCGTFTQDLN